MSVRLLVGLVHMYQMVGLNSSGHCSCPEVAAFSTAECFSLSLRFATAGPLTCCCCAATAGTASCCSPKLLGFRRMYSAKALANAGECELDSTES